MRTGRKSGNRTNRPARAALESLEPRQLLATTTATSTLDVPWTAPNQWSSSTMIVSSAATGSFATSVSLSWKVDAMNVGALSYRLHAPEFTSSVYTGMTNTGEDPSSGYLESSSGTQTITLPGNTPANGYWSFDVLDGDLGLGRIDQWSITITYTTVTYPEIQVTGNGADIADGDATPSLADGTDFGATTVGGTPISRTFVVSNLWTGDLILGRATAPPGFTVTTGLPYSIGRKGSANLIVRLNPSTVGTYSGDISFSTNDANENPFNFRITGTVLANTQAPADIALSSYSVMEHRPTGTVVATLSAVDPDPGNTFTYALVPGAGSSDNSAFTLSGTQLQAATDFDLATRSSYSIRIRATDQGGLWLEKVFTITVRPRVLYVDTNAPAPGSLRDGSSWANGYTDLQLALGQAISGDRILVADGTYKTTDSTDRNRSFVLKEGVTLWGGYAGYGAADPEARDAALYRSILSGDIGTPNQNSDNSFHVVTGNSLTAATVLDGLTIMGGMTDAYYSVYYGAGLYLYHASPTLSNCTFTANVADSGAGIYLEGSSPAISNCRFISNSAGAYGGGVDVYSFSAPVLSNCTFSGNSAWRGGGVNSDSSSPVVTGCTFSGNLARTNGAGGGMYCTYGAGIQVIGCTFVGNTAPNGGGFSSNYGSPTLTNCIFVGNAATASGGGLAGGYSSSPQVTNCTFSSNTAGSGSAIYGLYDSGLVLTNSIVWTSGFAPIAGGATVTYSDIRGGFTGTGNLNADPKFVRTPSAGADGQWGTSDDDYGDLRLQSASPAIDAGNSAAPGLTGITTDFRGAARVIGPAVDMGAYELDPPPSIAAVLINDGVAQRSTVKKLAVNFSEPVTLAVEAVTVKCSSGIVVPNTTVSVSNPSGDQQSYILTFGGTGAVAGSLADGIYDLIVSAAGVQDLAGNALVADYTQRFHRLFGDVDGNRVVNALDYAKLKATYGRAASDPLFSSAFDYEGNSVINALDLAQFRKRYGLLYSY